MLLSPTSPSRWFEADSNQPVVFYVNPTWSTSGGSLRMTYGGTTGGCGVQQADGINTISFNTGDSYFAASQGGSGLLAV